MPVPVRFHLRVVSVAVALLALMPTKVAAQNSQQPACSGTEYRQFDFWAGVGGSVGESFNVYDRRSGTWHQTWVDNGGLLLQLDGQLENGSMVLRSEVKGTDGVMRRQRITWTPSD